MNLIQKIRKMRKPFVKLNSPRDIKVLGTCKDVYIMLVACAQSMEKRGYDVEQVLNSVKSMLSGLDE